MKQVEEALHQLHARDKEKQARDMAEAHKEAMSRNLDQSEGLSPPQAFAKVNSISPGSPASIAGLQVDDEIVEFGSVNTQNFQSLHNIGNVVQHSEGVSWKSHPVSNPGIARARNRRWGLYCLQRDVAQAQRLCTCWSVFFSLRPIPHLVQMTPV
uniref:26S proteasome non-ATPase regulatory subunit 9-like n=1 Tax=Panthera onca TaxID=9690 RepID=UPI0029543560|nr:26S proteasome non-ATPase regulatory subunit 9-like [Panthera onca]